ncbi:MAG: deoxyribodipyrimidine photo-lyase [Desulfovibrionaceae bacterium]
MSAALDRAVQRARLRDPKAPGPGPVVYWMHREHRLRDNWGLLLAQQIALASDAPLAVVHCLAPGFGEAGLRQYAFLVRGLLELAAGLRRLDIPLVQLLGDPGEEVPRFLAEHRAGGLVTDFDPAPAKRSWVGKVLEAGLCRVWEADSRNVVPAWLATDRKEYMARTFRPRLRSKLADFLEAPPGLQAHPRPFAPDLPGPSLGSLDRLGLDRAPSEAPDADPGEQGGLRRLAGFLDNRLPRYAEASNDPTREAVSRLSAHLRFGQLASLRVALETRKADAPAEAKDAFLEQLLVRRELAENYVFFEPDHASLAGAPDWARKTLDDHRLDPREHVYSLEQFEAAATHDELWNAAQGEMVRTGFMHGYMRMYWAKKILEWSESPEEALRIAFRLNDRWQLDGRDSNGVAGIMWSIAGVHDQGFRERPVYGKIRYMNARGAARKFKVKAYIEANRGRERG